MEKLERKKLFRNIFCLSIGSSTLAAAAAFVMLNGKYNLLQIEWLILFLLFLLLFIIIKIHFRKEADYLQWIQQAPITIIILIDSKIYFINNEGIKLLGAMEEELRGTPIYRFIQIKEKRFPTHFKGKLRNYQGETINAEVDVTNIKYKGEHACCLVIRDVSELINNQILLRRSEKLSVLGELAAGIAHEIRNPITSIKGFLQLQQKDGKNENLFTDIMLSEIERMNNIVNELLLLAKPKEFEFEDKKIIPIIETVVTLINTQAIIHNIQIFPNIHLDAEKITVRCDENKLKQVFINILRNSIDAMPDAGEININVELQDGYVEIHFIDEGIGIAKEMLPNLGKRFFSSKESGTGLGLMISYTIIDDHGGRMKILSEEGKGTEVVIFLPLREETLDYEMDSGC